eukprot:12881-Heterococcus_DN1.PRE.4
MPMLVQVGLLLQLDILASTSYSPIRVHALHSSARSRNMMNERSGTSATACYCAYQLYNALYQYATSVYRKVRDEAAHHKSRYLLSFLYVMTLKLTGAQSIAIHVQFLHPISAAQDKRGCLVRAPYERSNIFSSSNESSRVSASMAIIVIAAQHKLMRLYCETPLAAVSVRHSMQTQYQQRTMLNPQEEQSTAPCYKSACLFAYMYSSERGAAQHVNCRQPNSCIIHANRVCSTTLYEYCSVEPRLQ